MNEVHYNFSFVEVTNLVTLERVLTLSKMKQGQAKGQDMGLA